MIDVELKLRSIYEKVETVFSLDVEFIEYNLSPPRCGEQCAKQQQNLGSPTPSRS